MIQPFGQDALPRHGIICRIVRPENDLHMQLIRIPQHIGLMVPTGRAKSGGLYPTGTTDRLVALSNFALYDRIGRSVQIDMVVGMIGDFVSSLHNQREHLGRFVHFLPDEKEGRPDIQAAQEIQQSERVLPMGAIVEGEGNLFSVRIAMPDAEDSASLPAIGALRRNLLHRRGLSGRERRQSVAPRLRIGALRRQEEQRQQGDPPPSGVHYALYLVVLYFHALSGESGDFDFWAAFDYNAYCERPTRSW